jgi:tetratricopeptide (TPR) repeat protein
MQAIEQVKDSCLLYTNRALTCLNLGLYSRVISDCEWAHKLNENSLKVWLYKARAYHEMGEEDKAHECLTEAESRNPDSKAQIQGKFSVCYQHAMYVNHFHYPGISGYRAMRTRIDWLRRELLKSHPTSLLLYPLV